MSWQPNPRVTIGATDFTQHAINRVTVNAGRATVYERPNAGYASVELIDVDGIPPFRVGDELKVFIDRAQFVWEALADSWSAVGSTWETVGVQFQSEVIFTGTVSDFTTDVEPPASRPVITHTIQAVGPLSLLNRRQIYFGGRVQETDGERLLNILTAALGTAAVNPDVVEPGVFDLAAVAVSDSGYNALSLAQETAFSGEGVLFETADGFIGYTNADGRLENERTRVLDIPFGELSVRGVRVLQQLADITNVVGVEYASGVVTAEDQDSINEFGRYESEIVTTLVNESNADARARQFLERHAVPSFVLDRLDFNLLGIDDVLRNNILELRPSEAIRVLDVPSRLGFTQFRGFVEGYRLTFDPFAAELTFVVSDRRLSIGAQRWQQVLDTIAWQDVDPTLTWADATEVTT